nr:EAL domain-containing protein [uncultured Sphingomonas sp.]
MKWRGQIWRKSGEWRPTKLLAWAIGLGLLFGAIQFGEIAEIWLRVSRNAVNVRPASGDIVIVKIDAKSQSELGNWPWNRSIYAKLVTQIDAYKPKVQVHDLLFASASNARDDNALTNALARAPNSYIAVQTMSGAQNGVHRPLLPVQRIRADTKLAVIDFRYDYLNQVWNVEYQKSVEGVETPTIAPLLAGVDWQRSGSFPVNYAFNPDTIPSVSASDVIAGRINPNLLRGKSVVVGAVDERIGDQYSIPGYGKFGGVYVHAIAAETLQLGAPVQLGWWPGYLLAAAASILAMRMRDRRRPVIIASTAAALIIGPILLERFNIFADVTPGLFVLTWVSCGLFLAVMKKRGLVNMVSGLPNLAALKRASDGNDRPLIVGKIINFAEIVSLMPIEAERTLVEQIVKRLRVGGEETTIYQSDEGIFAWTIPASTAIGHHVEALHALFRAPARVGGKSYDVSVAFGVEIGSGRSMSNRFGSALVAAEEAIGEGLKWKYHDPERLRDASWRLSLLGQLDNALANGEVWVAYQPQVDLRTGEIRGVEALARWTHPDKGPISPIEFISAAEQSDRIEPLTMFVLERAIETAARINREFCVFDMSVNLSARMLPDRGLPKRVKSMLQAHGLPAERLTLELTETADMANGGADLEALTRLCDLGINISIDDYGTGLSTLEYLKKVPANEIKIDQSFVRSMRDNRSDLVMVQSTIALAHSLGRRVVAEGVEDRESIDLLRSMNCEYAQGFAVGRPTSADGLVRRLGKPKKRRVA